MENIIAEIRQAKECLKTGNYELAYEMMQNADDELTTMLIRYNAIFTDAKDIENWQ